MEPEAFTPPPCSGNESPHSISERKLRCGSIPPFCSSVISFPHYEGLSSSPHRGIQGGRSPPGCFWDNKTGDPAQESPVFYVQGLAPPKQSAPRPYNRDAIRSTVRA